MHIIEVKNTELMQALTARLAELGVTSGAIVSLLGAVDSFTISTMPAGDPAKDIITTYDLPAEIHGSGEIVNGQPHVHVTMAVEGDRGLAGHLHQAIVGHWFVRAYVQPIS